LTNLGLPRAILCEAIRHGSANSLSGLPPLEFPAVPRVEQLVTDRFANPAWVERF
jgi:hypothetical protein